MVQSEREISELEISKEDGEAKVMFMGMFMGRMVKPKLCSGAPGGEEIKEL